MPVYQPELTVVTKAKDLTMYVFTVTEKSPRRFRFSLTGRMQSLCLDIVGGLYAANDTWEDASAPDFREWASKRLDRQHGVMTLLKELDYLLVLSREQGAILPKQQEHAGELLLDVERLLGAWIKSDRARFEGKKQ